MNYKSNNFNIKETFNSHFQTGANQKYSITNPGSALERIAKTKENIRQRFQDITPEKVEYDAPVSLSKKELGNIKKNYAEHQIAFNYALYSLLTAAESEIKNNVPVEKVQSDFIPLIERIANQEGLSPIPASIEGNKNDYLANNTIFLFIYNANRNAQYIVKPSHVKRRIKDEGDNL